MIAFTRPVTLRTQLLADALRAAGYPSTVYATDTQLVLGDLQEAHRASVAPIVTAHESAASSAAADETAQSANEATIRDRAAGALATNNTYIARASPTAAQNAAQIKALSQQMNGLIRLVLRRFDAAD